MWDQIPEGGHQPERRSRVDLRATSRQLLSPQSGVQPVPVSLEKPLPPGSVGLLLGRGSLTKQGLVVHPGVVDNQHENRIQVLCSCPSGIFSINPGDRIAQLLLLPENLPQSSAALPMGSSGTDSAYLLVDLRQRPQLVLWIEGKKFEGILDTGADRSIISSQWWPTSWSTIKSSHTLQGLGYASQPTVSSSQLHWKSEDGQEGYFTPYVLPLPVNLWGRDVMQELGLVLSNEYSPQAERMMQRMGFEAGQGLGKHEQGQLLPVQPQNKQDRKGLGFS